MKKKVEPDPALCFDGFDKTKKTFAHNPQGLVKK